MSTRTSQAVTLAIQAGELVCHVVALSLGFAVHSALTWVIVSDLCLLFCVQICCQCLCDLQHRRVSSFVVSVFGAAALGATPWTDSLLLSSYVLALVIYRGHSLLRVLLLTLGAVLLACLLVPVRCCLPHRPNEHLRLRLRRVASSLRQEVLGENADDNCSVCTEPMVQGDIIRVVPNCAHKFHVDCIDPWLRDHNTCPNCRGPVVVAPGEAPVEGAVAV